MKQFYTLIFTLLSCTVFAQQAYYDGIEFNQNSEGLFRDIAIKISDYNQSFTYGDNRDSMKITDDEDFNDADGNDTSDTVWLIYGYANDDNCVTDKTRNENSFGSGSCTYNREHVFARSQANPSMGSTDNSFTGIVADPHNIRPADGKMNSDRSNRKFADGSGTASGNVGANWYPGDEWKGDVARIIMYMYTTYGDRCLPEYAAVGEKEGDTDMLKLLLEWNVEDPVSDFEDQRNDYLETEFSNRNPFIDNPALATVFWGGPQAEDRWGNLSNHSSLQQNPISIYPNPTKGNAIAINNLQSKADIAIYDVLGKLAIKTSVNSFNKNVNIENLNKGVYLVRISSEGRTVTKKLIKN